MNTHTLAKLRSEQSCLGTWLSLDSPIVAELAAACGLDWLLIDMEHGATTEATLLPILQATGSQAMASVVRIPSHEPSLIGRVLDKGADAIMAPHVSSPEEASALVRAMRYAPKGDRGYSRTVRTYHYGLQPVGNDAPVLFAQIESVDGVRHAHAIAAVEGVDILFVGPSDLRMSLSGDNQAPSYEEALDIVWDAAKTHHKQAGILIRDRKDICSLLDRGFTKVAIDSDISMLRAGFSKISALAETERGTAKNTKSAKK